MAENKGIVQVAKEELARTEGLLEAEYQKFRECQKEHNRCADMLAIPYEEQTVDERLALEKEVSNWSDRVQVHVKRISSIESTIEYKLERELEHAEARVEQARRELGRLEREQEFEENRVREIKEEHQRLLAMYEGDSDKRSWSLKQAQQELDVLEGN